MQLGGTPSAPGLQVAVLDDYQRVARTMADWDRLGPDCTVTVFDQNLPLSEAAQVLAPFDVLCLMRERMPLPGSLLKTLPRLKLIVFTGVRTRSIDVQTAAECGVVVCHTRGGETQPATAELTWALVLAAMRHFPAEMAAMRRGGWQSTVGTTLEGRTLGLLGLGTLGRRVSGYGHAFGMDCIAWSPNLTVERAQDGGATLVDKAALFSRSDVLSVHMVLAPGTRHLVGTAELAAMRPDAVLVNTSRGPLVDEAALVEALRARRIRAAALDVFDQEPLPADHPLRRLDNAILTPHLGYVTEGSYRVFFEDTVAAILAWHSGAPIRTAT